MTKITVTADKIRQRRCKRVQELVYWLCFSIVLVALEDMGVEGYSRSLGICNYQCVLLALVLF